MRIKCFITIVLVFMMILMSSCNVKKEESDKIRDLEYTVLEESNFPEVVASKIESEKAEPFKFSYSDGEFIYIAIGYGEKDTTDYSIQVNGLYESENYLVVSTILLGPEDIDQAVKTPSYPYIVIKTENLGKAVCFK